MIAYDTKSLLERVIDASGGEMSPEVARSFLAWQFSDEDHRTMDELAGKARQGSLTPEESELFEEFCIIGDLLSLLHLRANDALHSPGSKGT